MADVISADASIMLLSTIRVGRLVRNVGIGFEGFSITNDKNQDGNFHEITFFIGLSGGGLKCVNQQTAADQFFIK